MLRLGRPCCAAGRALHGCDRGAGHEITRRTARVSTTAPTAGAAHAPDQASDGGGPRRHRPPRATHASTTSPTGPRPRVLPSARSPRRTPSRASAGRRARGARTQAHFLRSSAPRLHRRRRRDRRPGAGQTKRKQGGGAGQASRARGPRSRERQPAIPRPLRHDQARPAHPRDRRGLGLRGGGARRVPGRRPKQGGVAPQRRPTTGSSATRPAPIRTTAAFRHVRRERGRGRGGRARGNRGGDERDAGRGGHGVAGRHSGGPTGWGADEFISAAWNEGSW